MQAAGRVACRSDAVVGPALSKALGRGSTVRKLGAGAVRERALRTLNLVSLGEPTGLVTTKAPRPMALSPPPMSGRAIRSTGVLALRRTPRSPWFSTDGQS